MMASDRSKKSWLDPNREGRKGGRQAKRYCGRCGNSVQKFRILRNYNLCELCIKELENKRDGHWTCKFCGKLAPNEVKQHNGYCAECVCPACGRPDPLSVRKTGLCRECAIGIGDFCRICGKEAAAQVRKNHGICNQCAKQ
jgi:hypothetical protein